MKWWNIQHTNTKVDDTFPRCFSIDEMRNSTDLLYFKRIQELYLPKKILLELTNFQC